MKLLSLPLLLLAGAACAQTQTIKLNQLGFLPQSQKLAVVPQGAGARFEIVGADGKTVVEGKLGAATAWAPSGETVRVADFSWLSKPGAYRDIVLLNAAASLMVAGKVKDLKAGVARAAEAIASGRAQGTLDKLAATSQRTALAATVGA